MLGNDIVDLSDPETSCGGQHSRFDERVFSVRERAALGRSSDPKRARWVLWAVKESAFKGVSRVEPETVFSPARFAVDFGSQLQGSQLQGSQRLDSQLPGSIQGSVAYRDKRYRATVELDRDCIHAIVSDDSPPTRTVWGTQRIAESGAHENSTASQRVRALAISRLAARLGIDRADLSIERSGRIPHLLHRGVRLPAALSLSHHGSYVGFACRLASGSISGVDTLAHSPLLARASQR